MDEYFNEMEKYYNKALNVCCKKIEHLSHPEVYGCCLSRCNSIVINKDRMMVVTTDKSHYTTYEFAPIYPTRFSPKAAKKIVESDIYTDFAGNHIKLEIVGDLEYYYLLKSHVESCLRSIDYMKRLFVV